MNEQVDEIYILVKKLNYVILDFYNGFRKNSIYIVTPIINENIENEFSYLKFICDNSVLDRGHFDVTYEFERMGWYYQQFLKYELVLKSKYRYVLVIDGDSFFDFRAKNLRNVVYVTDKNVNKRYLNFVSGELCIPALQKNAITNQMLFDKILLKSMISFIEFDSCEMNYIDVIHAKIISSKGRFLFSEYQTYASWCVSKRKYPISKIKVFRRIDLLYSLDSFSVMEALRSYFLVAYEPGHRSGCLRKIRAFIYYKLKLNLG